MLLSKAVRAVAWCELGTLPLFLAVPFRSARVQHFTFRKVSPPTSTYSLAAGINQKGIPVGSALQDSGCQFKGFASDGTRYRTIFISGPEQNKATGVNDSNTAVGFFDGYDGVNHGFLIKNGAFTQYDVNQGVVSTYIYGINNAGNFTGFVGVNGGNQGLVNVGSKVTQFTVNGNPTIASAIHSSNDTVGGWGYPIFVNYHCFYRTADGTITPIDHPGAASRLLDNFVDYYISQGVPYRYVASLRNKGTRSCPKV
jgi:hypothetical protein